MPLMRSRCVAAASVTAARTSAAGRDARDRDLPPPAAPPAAHGHPRSLACHRLALARRTYAAVTARTARGPALY
jgi:hypothetical protein